MTQKSTAEHVTSSDLEIALVRLLRMLGLPENTPFKALGPHMQNLIFDMAVNRGH